MRRIYVSTVGRGKQKEESSKIYCIDCDTGDILSQVKLPLSMLDLRNPRGGCRGARGLCFHNSQLYAAGFDGLFELRSDDLFINRGRWFNRLKDIHQIYSVGGLIQVANTFTNEICGFDPVTDLPSCIFEDLSDVHPGLPAPDWFPECRDTLHLNSFSAHYALCAKAAIIIDRKTRQVCMEDQECLRGSHDIWELPTGEVAINNSKLSRTITIDQKTWKLKRVLYQETNKEGGSELAVRGWTRGMFYLPQHDLLMVGSSPAEVIFIENVSDQSREAARIPISDEIVEATFDVVPHPEDWK